MPLIRTGLFLLNLFLGFMAFAAMEPEAFLYQQKKIRVYVDKAPGFGHQSAGISVMRRLRELNFQGEFEVIYHPTVAEKIRKIYPGFPEGIPNQVKYVPIEDYQDLQKQGKNQRFSLAISGADDGFGESFAKIAMADTYLRLQPLGWGHSAIYGEKLNVLWSLQSMPLVNLQSSISEKFTEGLKKQTDLSGDRKDFVLRFAELAPKNLSFPIYGVGVQTFAPQKLYFYAKAVKSAAQKIGSGKAVIIPVISPFNELEMDTVLKVFGKTPGFEGATATEKKHQNQMHILSPQEFVSLESLKPGNLYFVFVGSVPQNIFNYFYESANLPVWVAGKNAMSFAASKGKVYFNTVDDYYLPGKESVSLEGQRKMHRAQRAFSVGYQEFANQHHLSALSQFIQEASTTGTELYDFYSGVGKQMSANDKVLEGLRNILGSPSVFMCQDVFSL